MTLTVVNFFCESPPIGIAIIMLTNNLCIGRMIPVATLPITVVLSAASLLTLIAVVLMCLNQGRIRHGSEEDALKQRNKQRSKEEKQEKSKCMLTIS